MALLDGRGGREILEVAAAPLLVWSGGRGVRSIQALLPSCLRANRLESIWLSPLGPGLLPTLGCQCHWVLAESLAGPAEGWMRQCSAWVTPGAELHPGAQEHPVDAHWAALSFPRSCGDGGHMLL